MKLYELISKSGILHGEELLSLSVGKPVCDSRKVQPHDVLFDISNNEDYAKAATTRGCAVTVREYSGKVDNSPNTVYVKNVRLSYAEACEKYAGDPTKDMHLIAVTGTNGKTSTTHILAAILRKAGYKTGIIGTVGNFIGNETAPTDYTTPPPDVLSELFRKMKNDGVSYVVLEASSHALDQDRLGGLTFDAGIFTNLTRDHLDYHKTMENLAKAKAKLFPACRASIINLDDVYAKQMAFASAGDVYFCSENDKSADFFAKDIECGIAKTNFRISSYFGNMDIKSKLTGSFNVYNVTLACAAARVLGVGSEHIMAAVRDFDTVSGRMECISKSGVTAVIDFAHTPDALENALRSLSPLCKGRLITVFGCGGERDTGKRPLMGGIAEKYSDKIYLTSDNPRSENPDVIISQIADGIKNIEKTVHVTNRKDAVISALSDARDGDVVLIAGKGHETFTEDSRGKHRYSDKETVTEFFEKTQNEF